MIIVDDDLHQTSMFIPFQMTCQVHVNMISLVNNKDKTAHHWWRPLAQSPNPASSINAGKNQD